MPPTTLRPTAPENWLIAAITGCTRGVLAGQRRALRTVLAARFGPLAPATHARIAACDHLVQLDAWLRAAATAPTLAAIWRADAHATTADAMAEDTADVMSEDTGQDTTEAITEAITQGIVQDTAPITAPIAQDISADADANEPAEHAA